MPGSKANRSKPEACAQCGGNDLARRITTYSVRLTSPESWPEKKFASGASLNSFSPISLDGFPENPAKGHYAPSPKPPHDSVRRRITHGDVPVPAHLMRERDHRCAPKTSAQFA